MVYQSDAADARPRARRVAGRYRNRQTWHVVDSCDAHVDDKAGGAEVGLSHEATGLSFDALEVAERLELLKGNSVSSQ